MKYFLFLIFCCLTLTVQAQDLYDLTTLQTIEITFAESNWDQLLDNAYASTGDYILAESVTVNGVHFDSVGVKYKGNSTYQANQAKNPFHIELDTYKDQEYDGYTDLKLSNVAKDPSFLREVLSYQILRQYMDAPQSNYANVYVNGDLIGLYSNSESISRKFVDKHYGSKDNTRFKCSPPDGAGPTSSALPNLAYLSSDSSAYYDAYELKSDYGWAELINLCDTLANHVDAIAHLLDVDRTLWMLAFDNVFVNLDSYIGRFAQNYYLYKDDHGRFLPTVWDLNESLGVFSDAGSVRFNSTAQKAQMSHLLHENEADYPLVRQLLSVPQYKRKYLAHVKTMLEENFANGDYEDTAVALRATIDGAVQADGNKFFTYNDFVNNLTADAGTTGGGPGGGRGGAPGITSLMDARADYLLGLNDFAQTEPTITNISLSNNSPTLNESLTITTTVTDALRVYLNYRTVNGAPFEQLELFDDGQHGDEAAGDGVYGGAITLTNLLTEYYFYAENDGIGKFEPQRAEHEFFEIVATNGSSSLAGDLVINEFMASNDTTQADQDGEFDDWIELYNNLDVEINLDGFFLTDDLGDLTKWAFPNGTLINGGGYLIIWADGDTEQDGLHADFRLSAGGESVLLVDADGTIVDSISYPDQATDISYGRFPNGTGDFQDMTPTFNAENAGDTVEPEEFDLATSPLAGDIVINEFMADNETVQGDQDGEFDDWIELYNNTSNSISLTGFSLADDLGNPTKYTFPEGTSIAANGYLIVWADEDGEQEGLHANFRLAAGGETLLLVDTDTALVDSVTYFQQIADVSYGRFPNGTGNFRDMNPTFNGENSGNVTSTDQGLRAEIGLSVFPNPVRNQLNVRLRQAYGSDLQFRLVAANGRLISDQPLARGGTTLDLNTADLPAGLYMLLVTSGRAMETHKIMVSR